MSNLKPIADYLIPLYRYHFGKILQKPTVYLRMTPKCNLKCTICDEWNYSVHKERHDPSQRISTQDYMRLIDNLADYKIERLQFGGGEALLREDTLKLINYAKIKGLTTRILTNGTLLSKKKIAESLAKGIDEVWLSIDSPDPKVHDTIRGVPGTFEKVMTGINNLNELRIKNGSRHFKICVATHFSPHNIFDPDDFIQLMYRSNVDFMLFTPTYDGNYGQTRFTSNIKNSKDRANLVQMIQKVRKIIYSSRVPIQTNPISLDIAQHYYKDPNILSAFKCYIGGYDLAFIETNGDVYPCTAYPVSMGNIRDIGYNFQKLWFGEQANNVRKKIKRLECGGCFHLQTQKNHLYHINSLLTHILELPRLFFHLLKTHNISNPSNVTKRHF